MTTPNNTEGQTASDVWQAARDAWRDARTATEVAKAVTLAASETTRAALAAVEAGTNDLLPIQTKLSAQHCPHCGQLTSAPSGC